MTPFDQAQSIRDRRLRRWLLRLLYDARGNAMSGETLHELLGYAVTRADMPEDRDHTRRLLHDMANAGFAGEADTRRLKDERITLATLEYSITADGTALIEQQREPSPLVEDDRR